MTDVKVEELREVPAFEELTAEQLEWLARHGDIAEYEPGESIFEPGRVAEHMFAVIEGAIEVTLGGGGQHAAFTQRRGALSGLLPFSRMRTYTAAGRAVGRTRVYRIHRTHFARMLEVAPLLGPRLVSLMTDRVRETTRLAQQREKMMALGKLAAGLAHELYNPAAAVRRHADALAEQLDRLPELTRALLSGGVEVAALGRTGELLTAASARASDAVSGLQRSRLEQELGAWLDAQSVGDSWMLVEPLVDAGLRPEHLRGLADSVPRVAVAPLMNWIATVVGARHSAEDIRSASARISQLVGSVKVYSHMDRASDRERVDLREGLETTIVMLGHELKRKSITLERAYSPDVPRVDGFPGELNQVWTNLVDNAIDAMPEHGVLRVETEREGGAAVVRIIDSGAGISPEIQSRVFEPFFTTKAVGEGTGLGLDIVQRIVVQQHGGRIDVESQPGRTVFTVRLPIDASP